MLNIEKYKDEIFKLVIDFCNDNNITEYIAVNNGKPRICQGLSCKECDLYSYGECINNFLEWMLKETSKIDPCPFCGSVLAPAAMTTLESYSGGYGADDRYCVVCDRENGGCGSSTGGMYKTREEAIKAWNRRA